MSTVVLDKVSRIFDIEDSRVAAVQETSMTINQGEFVSIVGHSGSGKTTLLSIIGGILKPTSGRVSVGDIDVYSLSEDDLSTYRAERVGYMFQFASLLPVLTAKENLLLPTLFRRSGPTEADDKKATELLELVGLGTKVNAFPSQLSGGQQRRVAIARALINNPALLLADEPTGDLDEETEAEMMTLFKRINKDQGITFIMVTHSSELAAMASRKLRMTHGRLEEIS